MRALTYDGPFHVRIRDKPCPRIEHPQDAIVEVTAAAICGSDLHLIHGLVPDTRVGFTLGHEIVGVVVETGPQCTGLSKGDRVMLPFQIFCGSCEFCQRGQTASCENTNPASDLATGCYGYAHLTGGYDGGQAEYVRVPFADVDAERVPDDLSDLDALPLTDAFATGYQAAEMCDLQGGETVIVFGCGPVGLYAMRSAWMMGAGRVIAVDHVEDRLAFARRWAGVEAWNFRELDVIEAIREETGGRGAHCSIDAVGCEAAGSAAQRALGVYGKLIGGSAQALNGCFHATRKGGTVSVVGVYGPPFALVDFGTAMNRQLTVRTGQASVKRYLPRLIEHVRAGRIDSRPIFTHRLPLEEGPKAYHTFAQKKDGCIKVALFPHGERATFH
jgi:threonine dehydrogenase-like Zn-dependent dehydrogenase